MGTQDSAVYVCSLECVGTFRARMGLAGTLGASSIFKRTSCLGFWWRLLSLDGIDSSTVDCLGQCDCPPGKHPTGNSDSGSRGSDVEYSQWSELRPQEVSKQSVQSLLGDIGTPILVPLWPKGDGQSRKFPKVVNYSRPRAVVQFLPNIQNTNVLLRPLRVMPQSSGLKRDGLHQLLVRFSFARSKTEESVRLLLG